VRAKREIYAKQEQYNLPDLVPELTNNNQQPSDMKKRCNMQ